MAEIDFFYYSTFIFKETQVLIEEGSTSEKIVIVEEELDCIDINNIRNSENLLKSVLIHEECGNTIMESLLET